MEIIKITADKKKYLDLLLLADESEHMVDKYLDRGEMFVLNDDGVKAECVVTKESDGVYELKNIAVVPEFQRKGYGKALIDSLFSHYPDCRILYVGTGEVPSTLGFYKACGFTVSHRVKNFFTDNYDHLMFEDNIQLIDMVYLRRECKPNTLVKLRAHGELAERAAVWFHDKWNIPLAAYRESIAECLENKNSVPQWYLALHDGKIVGGMGVIANDFHDRPDLTPNVCAVYVEKEYRNRGIAGELLQFVCDDMAAFGICTLYLVTDHTSFYERYGWHFLCMVKPQGEDGLTRMYIHRINEKD